MSNPKKRSALLAKVIASLAIFGFLVIAIPNFIRARNTSARNACVNNLRQIDGAKQQWALENQRSSNDIPASVDIAVYIKNSTFPHCPDGGTYIIGRVSADPRCSIGGHGHVLPTP